MSKFVTMRWPEGLAERVDVVAGPGGRTDFVVAAVYAALDATPSSGVVDAPKGEATHGTARSGACDSFKPRPGNALRCFTCGERLGDHA